MITEIIDKHNRQRPQGEKQLSKKQIITTLQEKGLIKGYEYGIAMFNKLDRKEQDRISISILKELSHIFKMSIDEIVSYY